MEPKAGTPADVNKLRRGRAAEESILSAEIEISEALHRVLRLQQRHKPAEDRRIDPAFTKARGPGDLLASQAEDQPHKSRCPLELIVNIAEGKVAARECRHALRYVGVVSRARDAVDSQMPDAVTEGYSLQIVRFVAEHLEQEAKGISLILPLRVTGQ